MSNRADPGCIESWEQRGRLVRVRLLFIVALRTNEGSQCRMYRPRNGRQRPSFLPLFVFPLVVIKWKMKKNEITTIVKRPNKRKRHYCHAKMISVVPQRPPHCSGAVALGIQWAVETIAQESPSVLLPPPLSLSPSLPPSLLLPKPPL